MMLRGGTSSIFTGVSRSQGEVCGVCGFAGSCVWRESVFGGGGGRGGVELGGGDVVGYYSSLCIPLFSFIMVYRVRF